MKKNITIPKQTSIAGKIPAKATELFNDIQEGHPVFSFRYACNNNCLLSDWHGKELDELIDTFKTMESMTWNDLLKHKGLRYKAIDKYTKQLPVNVSPDVTLCEIRVCQKKRIFGFRAGNIFRIIWFDRKHEVCSERRRA